MITFSSYAKRLSFLTPIRGEDAPLVPHTDPVYHSPETQEEVTMPRLLSANSGYARGGGILHLPSNDSLGNPRLQSPHSPGRPPGGGADQWGPTLFRAKPGRGGRQ